MTEGHTAENDAAIVAATVAALRYAASLAHSEGHEDLASDLYSTAEDAAAHDFADSWCCPVCEEVTCDDGCPLEPIRVVHDCAATRP